MIQVAIAVVAGAVTLLATMMAACDDIGGVPSRERCRSWFGNPIVEWPGGNWSPIVSLLIGAAVGFVIWWLLRFTPLKRRDRDHPMPARSAPIAK